MDICGKREEKNRKIENIKKIKLSKHNDTTTKQSNGVHQQMLTTVKWRAGDITTKQILVNNNHVKLELVLRFASIKWRRQWMSVSTLFNKIQDCLL